MKTEFAPAERASSDEIKEDVFFLNTLPMVHQFINMIPDVFLLLNPERQIVYMNSTAISMLGVEDVNKVYGLRPGEALNCIHADETTGGCGTTTFCRYCGAVNAIMKSQEAHDKVVEEECRISSAKSETSFDFRVWANTITIGDKLYTVFVVRDISNEKRRSVLEKTFFHDILNTAGGIQGVMGILGDTTGKELDELIRLVETAADTMIEEIRMQKDLLRAESGDLKVALSPLNSLQVLEEVKKIYLKHEVSEYKTILIAEDAESIEFNSDIRILKRIVGNMLKNALEATKLDSTVTMGCRKDDDKTFKFYVHNDAVMPEEVKAQIFQRSFSTKGEGRGIGTYSIKLFGEKYLKGKVFFTSEEGEGTTVYLQLSL